MLGINILCGIVAALLLLGVICENDNVRNTNITISFCAVIFLIVAINVFI